MSDIPLNRAPRPVAPPDVARAAITISVALWYQPYEPGRGPVHWATGPATAQELRTHARRWQHLAENAAVIAEWLEAQS